MNYQKMNNYAKSAARAVSDSFNKYGKAVLKNVVIPVALMAGAYAGVEAANEAAKLGKITGDNVQFRKGPIKKKGNDIGSFNTGNKVQFMGYEKNGYVKVKDIEKTGKTGYVHESLVANLEQIRKEVSKSFDPYDEHSWDRIVVPHLQLYKISPDENIKNFAFGEKSPFGDYNQELRSDIKKSNNKIKELKQKRKATKDPLKKTELKRKISKLQDYKGALHEGLNKPNPNIYHSKIGDEEYLTLRVVQPTLDGKGKERWLGQCNYSPLEAMVAGAKKKVKSEELTKILEDYPKAFKKIKKYVGKKKFKKADKLSEKWQKKLLCDGAEAPYNFLVKYDNEKIDPEIAKLAKEKRAGVAKSTSTIPSTWTADMGISRGMGGPTDLTGVNFGLSKGKVGINGRVAQGSYNESSVLDEDTQTGTRFDTYGRKDLLSDADVTELGIEAKIENILGPFGVTVGYANEVINRVNQTKVTERILKDGAVVAENTDTYTSNDRDSNGKARAGLQVGLGKGWNATASRDITGDNRRTTIGINKRLGPKTTNK